MLSGALTNCQDGARPGEKRGQSEVELPPGLIGLRAVITIAL